MQKLENKLFEWLEKEIGFNLKVIDAIFLIIVSMLALLLRLSLFKVGSGDYFAFLRVWMNEMKAQGGMISLKYEITNYTTPYTLILTLLTYLPIQKLFSIKLVSIFFDYLLATIIFKMIYYVTRKINLSIIGFTTILIIPTIFLNSAAWAQCDVIYTTFLVLCLYYFIKDNPTKAMVFFGIAFSIKLQSIFFIPLLAFMWLMRRVKLSQFFYIPLVYFITMLPALIAGRPLKQLLKVYLGQANQDNVMTVGYPNFYAMFEGKDVSEIRLYIGTVGMVVAIIIIGIILYYLFKMNVTLSPQTIIQFTMLTMAIMLYLLPHMHERYGYALDVLAVILAVINPKKLVISISCILVSFFAYTPYLFGVDVIALEYVSILLLAIIVLLCKDVLYGKDIIGECDAQK